MVECNDDFLVLFFENENKYDIVAVDACKNFTFETADACYNNEWYTGRIKCRGTRRKCEKKEKKYANTGSLSTDEDLNSNSNTIASSKTSNAISSKKVNGISKAKSSNKRLTRTRSHEGAIAADNLQNELGKLVRLQQDLQQIETNHELTDNCNLNNTVLPNNDSSEPEVQPEEVQPEEVHQVLEVVDISQILLTLQEINNKLVENNNNIVELRQSMEEIKSSINSKNKSEKTWLTELMYNGQDLLQVEESAYNKYVCTLMTMLFTKEELTNGLIVLNEKSLTKRQHLDVKKFEIIKTATINKFKMTDSKKIKKILEIANRKCRDTEITE